MFQLAQEIAAGRVSPIECVDACLRRIAALNEKIRAFITVLDSAAQNEARRAEQAVRDGRPLGRLHGIPFAAKDNFSTAGVRTTCASGARRDWIPEADAEAVAAIRREGAILIGKTNLTEFAWRANHPDFPSARNPWNLEHSCGGSSSGSAMTAPASAET